jgi:hypothetical protein
MTTRRYRIAALHPVVYPVQILTPFAWRLSCTLFYTLPLLSTLHVNSKHVSQEDFQSEVMALVYSFPKKLARMTSSTVDAILEQVQTQEPTLTRRDVCVFFYLAWMEEDVYFIEWRDQVYPSLSLSFFHQVQAGIEQDRASAMRTMRKIVLACIQYDVQDRFKLARDHVLHVPHFAYRTRNWILLFLAHFHRGWVKEFTRRMKCLKDPQRVQDWIRQDPGLYCTALVKMSEELSPNPVWESYVERFKAAFYGEGSTPWDPSRVIQQKAMVFCSKYPVMIWTIMGWPCSVRERKQLAKMAEGTFSITIAEAVDVCISCV